MIFELLQTRGRESAMCKRRGCWYAHLWPVPQHLDSDSLAQAFSSVCSRLCVKWLLGHKCMRGGSGLGARRMPKAVWRSCVPVL